MWEDLTGKRFGHLVVIASAEKNPVYPSSRNWKVLCDCGRETSARTSVLNNGHKVNCGLCHFHTERIASSQRTHGKSHTRLYRIFRGMLSRCKNKNLKEYKDYGGRGISVCDEWENSFECFESWANLSGYKENLTIERIDNNSNYYPGNCTWITLYEQASNKRSNRLITYNNETKTMREWARTLNFRRGLIKDRLRRGWSTLKALSTPPRKCHQKGESDQW